jgi:hypothetical protein
MLRDGLIPQTTKAVVLLSGDSISRTGRSWTDQLCCVVSCRALNWDAFSSENGCYKDGCLRKRFLTDRTDRVVSTVAASGACAVA